MGHSPVQELLATLVALFVAVACTEGSPLAGPEAFGPTPEPSPTATRTLAPAATITSTPVPPPASTPTSAVVAPATAIASPVPTPTPARVSLPSPTPSPGPPVRLTALTAELAFPNLSYNRMTFLTYPDDGSGRLFLLLQPGRIMVFDDDPRVSSAETFLDMRERVSDRGNEEGLLGIAFDPDYRDNGFFYVYYSAASPRRSVISRFSVRPDDPSQADPASERVIMEVPQPFSNHNGGQIVFGPDGHLYVGLGDGGSGGDPQRNGQDLTTLLGSMLRIDVKSAAAEGTYLIPTDNPFAGRGGGVREEIWAYGLRNPWRFSFDRETGDLWAGDVGQNAREEIDIIKRGLNYGWNIMEGTRCFGARTCDQQGLEPPVVEYGRGDGCSVTGGYVYRGSRLPSLYGAYVYGDFCSGKIWALLYEGSSVVEHVELDDTQLSIASFAEGPDAELYVLSFDGKIYRLVPK